MINSNLLIIGMGRSGSTAFDRLIASRTGRYSLGEVTSVFRYGRVLNEVCSCGSRFLDCEFWAQVSDDIPELQSETAARQVVAMQSSILNFSLPNLLLQPLTPEYSDLVGRLHTTIGSVVGASGFVDSTKNPHYARHLLDATIERPDLIHLLRDPRGVAESMSRNVSSGYQAHATQMRKASMSRACNHWLYANLGAEALGKRNSVRRVRIEDLAEPQVREALIAELSGLPSDPAAGSVTHHQVGGNPMRSVVDFKFAPPARPSAQAVADKELLLSLPALGFGRLRYKYEFPRLQRRDR